MKTTKKSYRLYILMRNDLPSMNPGRAMAQAAHAANQFIHKHGKATDVKAWQKEANGFGTTICLSVSKDELFNIMANSWDFALKAGVVYDPTYRYTVHSEMMPVIDSQSFTAPPMYKEDGQVVLYRNESTCGYLFIADDNPERERLVGHLPLHP